MRNCVDESDYVLPHTTLPAMARDALLSAIGSDVTIQKHFVDREIATWTAVGLSKRKRLEDQRGFRVRCEAVSQMQNGVEGRGEIVAWKPRDSICALCLPVGDASFGRGIGIILGRSDMANRLPPIAAFFIFALLVSGLTDARAAVPGFCRQYAKAVVSQVRGALADPRCGAGVQGARWSTDFSVHYEWCLGASLDAASAERDARTRYLRACTSR
jgi:hypothetical protein